MRTQIGLFVVLFLKEQRSGSIQKKKKIEKIEYWINTMYRKSLGWKTAEECYEEERLLLGIGMT